MKRSLFVTVLVILAVGLAGPARADAQDTARRVAQEIISPYCPGVTLHDCPSSEGDEMRREILEMAKSGMSHDEIIDALVAERGRDILATPSNPIARALPFLLLLAGAAAAMILIARWSRTRASGDGPAPLDPGAHARVTEELDRFRSEG